MSSEHIPSNNEKQAANSVPFWLKAQATGLVVEIGGFLTKAVASVEPDSLGDKIGTAAEGVGGVIGVLGIAAMALEAVKVCWQDAHGLREQTDVATAIAAANIQLTVALANRWDDHMAYRVPPTE